MTMKRSFAALVAFSFALVMAAFAGSNGEATQKRHRVVFELTSGEPTAWNALLNNVENVRKALGEAATDVEIVAHGPGLDFLKASNTQFTARMQVLAKAGVIFAACENTMRRQGVMEADLFPFAVTVDSGVAEIVRKQEAGWSYLRTGG